MVLLHWLHFSCALAEQTVQAIYVDHGLQASSKQWAEFCRQQCEHWQIPVQTLAVELHVGPRQSVEAAARDARYQAFSQSIPSGQLLLTAHHQRDQVETLLLALKRGSGPAGLAAMPVLKPLADLWHGRPFLSLSKAELEHYAQQHHLQWVDDPSNEDTRFDRNFIRQQLLPELTSRWPAFINTAARSAELCAEQQQLADEVAEQDFARCLVKQQLSIEPLQALSAARRNNVLRYWLRRHGAPMLSQRQLQEGWQQMTQAAADAMPALCWQGWQWRRYRHELYLLSPAMTNSAPAPSSWLPQHPTVVGGRTLRKVTVDSDQYGCCWPVNQPLHVQQGGAGKRLRVAGKHHSSPLKQLWKEAGIPPWERTHWPLLCDESGAIVMVPGLWVSAEYAAEKGTGWWAEWL